MKTMLAVTLLLALIWVACGSSVDQRALSAAEAQWAASGPDSYSYVYSRSCECDDLTRGRKLVHVVDGTAVSVIFLEASEDRSLDPVTYGYTVEQLFALIDTQIASGVVNEVAYSDLGYPSVMLLDLDAMAVDGGFSLTIHEFDAT